MNTARRRFNMVEVTIAMVIILVTLTSAISLIPKGLESNAEAMDRIAAGDSADQVLSYLATRVGSDWEGELAAFPTSLHSCASEDNVVWSQNAEDTKEGVGVVLLPGTDLLLQFNSANEAAGYDPSTVGGLFKVSHRTDEAVIDFTAVTRVWMELDVVHADPTSLTLTEQIANANGAKLNAEVSWPADLPYEKRKRAVYSLSVSRSVASGVPATTADDCVVSGEISGTASLCPTNNTDFSFEMRTSGGTVITRDSLLKAGSAYTFKGAATYIRFCPKSTGNKSSTLTVNGTAYEVNNLKCYTLNGDAMGVSLWNDKSGTGVSLGHWFLDIDPSGATIEGTCGEELEVAEAEEEEDKTGTFTIKGGVIETNVATTTSMKVLGCALLSGGVDCIITASAVLGGKSTEPFGDTRVKVTGKSVSAPGNVNTGSSTEVKIGSLDAGTTITITGTSYEPDGTLIMEQGSESNQNVYVLQNGDAIPSTTGLDKSTLETYLASYLDLSTNTVTLSENQAIVLFELGTTDLTSTEADFQDLAILVTMEPEE